VTLAVVLVRVERLSILRPGYIVALWVFGYGLGRLWVEALRSDAASLIAGVRVNIWMALLAILVGAVVARAGRIPPGERTSGEAVLR
jgi:Prolipoprotein diacylglyceryl transferase.